MLKNFNFSNNITCLRYRPEKFPGMFINLTNCTILLFSNGKLVVIGASNVVDAKSAILHVLELVRKSQNNNFGE